MKVCILLIMCLFSCPINAQAEPPVASKKYKSELIRTSHAIWGLDAPVALFAAQIHTESRWNENARSPVGAQGLAQFMPATAKWLPEIYPDIGTPMPFNPAWAMRAMVQYDKYLFNRIQAETTKNKWAFTLSAYNGGLGWVQKDKKKATQQGYNSNIYFEHVEKVNAGRSASNFKENRQYPKLIFERQDIYIEAGWGKGI